MVFTSPLFLFVFLPAALLLFHLSGRGARRHVLLWSSLAFYLVGSGGYIVVLIATIFGNFLLGLRLHNATERRKNPIFFCALCFNLAPLLVFKYSGLAADFGNQLFSILGLTWSLPVPALFLPAGISFFTFQGLAYQIDVRRGLIKPSDSLVGFALFKSFFPQLIAGPIVRYQQISKDLDCQRPSYSQFEEGMIRFCFGLGKKVLIADTLGSVADSIFASGGHNLNAPIAWLGLITYTFQIFFDFSGYSDMAIGLALLFGLRLPENFRQPYSAVSVTDFWRRWHITLSSWFRDYLYIPLGGNRHGLVRTALNLFLVFSLCGLWHGASYNYLIWGIFHGLALTLERVVRTRWQFEPKGLLGAAWTLAVVLGGWVWFRTKDIPAALAYFKALLGRGQIETNRFELSHYLTANIQALLLLAALLAFWRWKEPAEPSPIKIRRGWLRPCLALVVMALAVSFQAPRSFNPFIYFQF